MMILRPMNSYKYFLYVHKSTKTNFVKSKSPKWLNTESWISAKLYM